MLRGWIDTVVFSRPIIWHFGTSECLWVPLVKGTSCSRGILRLRAIREVKVLRSSHAKQAVSLHFPFWIHQMPSCRVGMCLLGWVPCVRSAQGTEPWPRSKKLIGEPCCPMGLACKGKGLIPLMNQGPLFTSLFLACFFVS